MVSFRKTSVLIYIGIVAVELVLTGPIKHKPLVTNRCAPRPGYCCDLKKLYRTFKDPVKSLISKVQLTLQETKGNVKNSCKETCAPRLKKKGGSMLPFHKDKVIIIIFLVIKLFRTSICWFLVNFE